MIQIEQLQDMFQDIDARGRWDMSQPMLWGYFFTDSSRERLIGVVSQLELQGYRFVKVFAPELDEGQEEYFFLHVEKEEIHSPQSLHERNQRLYAFADMYQLAAYDGMDLGPLPDQRA